MAGEIVHLEIPSRNFERSATFYGKLFGWRTDGVQSGGHLLFEIPGSQAEGEPGGEGMTGSWIRSALAQASGPLPFVAVDDIDETLAEAERQGGRILVPRLALAGKAQFGLLSDLDGNVIAVIARPPTAGTRGATAKKEKTPDKAPVAEGAASAAPKAAAKPALAKPGKAAAKAKPAASRKR
jgi:predicted enzyme related to lactoylglutathione lyase